MRISSVASGNRVAAAVVQLDLGLACSSVDVPKRTFPRDEHARRRLAKYELFVPPVASVRALLAHDRETVACGLSGELPSPELLDAMSAVLGGRVPPLEEIAALRTAPRHVLEAIATALGGEQPRAIGRGGRRHCSTSPAAIDDIRRHLPPALRQLEDTSLDPDLEIYASDEGHGIGCNVLERAGSLASPALTAAALTECLLFQRADATSPLEPVMSAWSGLDELLQTTGVDPWQDPRAYGRALAGYAAGKVLPGHRPALRRRVLGRTRAAWNLGLAYAAEFPVSGAEAQAALVPLPDLSPHDHEAIRTFLRGHERQCRRNRKDAARAIAKCLDAALAAGIARIAETRDLFDACSEAERIMRAEGLGGALDFGIDGSATMANGITAVVGRTMRLRAHWACELKAALDAGGAVQRALSLCLGEDRLAVGFDAQKEKIVFEFVSAEWTTDGESRAPLVPCPWPMPAAHAAAGVLLPAGGLNEEILERRYQLLAKQHLPFPLHRPPWLMGPSEPGETLLHQRALNAGIVLVSPAPYLHGLLLALGCALTMTTSFARVGEVRQIVHDEAGWTTLGRDPFTVDAFLSIPKGQSRPRPFGIAPMAFDALADIVEFAMQREGISELPLVLPARDLRRKCDAGRYVFAVRGRALTVADMNYLLAFLFSGIARARSHDLRHAAAMRARREGMCLTSVASFMNAAGGAVPHYVNDEFDPDPYPDDDLSETDMVLRQFNWFEARADAIGLSLVERGVA